MNKIEINIPEEIDDKNSAFSFCLSFLRWKIWSDDQLKWTLKPLWNTEWISMDVLLKELNKKLNRFYNMDDLSFHMREYERKSWTKLKTVKKYTNMSTSKVFLVEDLDWFKLYLLWLK